ncbi:unnamed protein product [Dovyalis caffra]|uniref:Ubiquitin-like domain-containing protein n=1 Tax=Dovyalis caffra TaxID=77055 RepID=A0AAV1SKB0_9ROSI|nr:unnamed protein product [Dovyalis caffra]
MKVKIVIDGRRHPLEVPDDATVLDLKKKVHEIFDISAGKKQEFFFNGLVLQDRRTLESYLVDNESEIELRIYYSVWIISQRNRKEKYQLKVHKNNFVWDLKQNLHVNYGLDITNMRLQIKPNSDLDDRTLLWANDITDGTKIVIAQS